MIHFLWIIFFWPDKGLSLIEIKQWIMNRKIAVHLANGFEEIEAVSIIDVLRRADIEVSVVSVAGKLEVTGAHQLKIMADILFELVDYDDIYMIVLPGGMPGASNLDAHKGLREMILKFNDANKQLAAICAAPMVYGKLGILEGKQAVCFPGFENYLKGAELLSKPVVESGNVLTANGPASAIQFALKIVEKTVSKEKSESIARQMLVEKTPAPVS